MKEKEGRRAVGREHEKGLGWGRAQLDQGVVKSVWLRPQGRVCRALWETRPEEPQGPDVKFCSLVKHRGF